MRELWRKFWLFFDDVVERLCQGAIIRAAGDDDSFDIRPEQKQERS